MGLVIHFTKRFPLNEAVPLVYPAVILLFDFTVSYFSGVKTNSRAEQAREQLFITRADIPVDVANLKS